MPKETKRTRLLYLVGALISLVFLSGSLSNLELRLGTPFPGVDHHYTAQQAASRQIQAYSFAAIPGIFGLILLLMIIYVLIRVTAFVNLNWLLSWLSRFILALAALFIFLIFLSYLNIGTTGASEWALKIVPSPPTKISTSPLGQPPKEFIWIAAIGFILATGFFIIKVFGRQLQPSRTEDSLLQPAKNAIQALRAGKDFRNVIIRCYLEMTNRLQEERGIERSHDMTVREFEDWLAFKGLPRVPVRNLTHLFEKVRYGEQYLGENDEKIALDSLTEIIRFAERTKDEVSPE